MRRRFTPGFTLFFAILAVVAIGLRARAQTPQSSASAPATAQKKSSSQTPAAVRVTARVIQVSVLVQDKKGNPVTDLKQSDFKLLDDGHTQPIQFFNVYTGSVVSELPVKLPPNVYTNDPAQTGRIPANLIIILVDALNTPFRDQEYAREQLLKYLRQLKPQDHVAIYTLGDKLRVLQDFTTDDAALVRAAQAYKNQQSKNELGSESEGTTVNPGSSSTDELAFKNLILDMTQMEEQVSQYYLTRRLSLTLEAFRAIASHVSAVPGRKNLLWLSGSFPLVIGTDNLMRQQMAVTPNALSVGGNDDMDPNSGDNPMTPQTTYNFDSLAQTVRALDAANVSVYPVDAQGLVAPSAASKMFETTGVDLQGYPNNEENLSTMSAVAEDTGGRAFFNSNDIGGSLVKAEDDSEYSYMLGYVPHDTWNGKFHKIKVEVDRKDVRVRSRGGYYAVPAPRYTPDQRDLVIRQAEASPLDATQIPLIVRFDPLPNPNPTDKKLRVYSATVFAYGRYVEFAPRSDSYYHAAMDYVISQRDAQGGFFAGTNMTYDFKLRGKPYEEAVKGGVTFRTTVTLDPRTADVRIIARDAATGALGSVTIPVPGPSAAQANPAPAKPTVRN